MNGKERLQAQIASGVRELVEDIDYLRIKFGSSNQIKILTPRVETRLRSGYTAAIAMKLQFVYEKLLTVTLTYEMTYPRESPINIEIVAAAINDDEDVDLTLTKDHHSNVESVISTPLIILSEDEMSSLKRFVTEKCQERDDNGFFLRTPALCDCLRGYVIDHLLPHSSTTTAAAPAALPYSSLEAGVIGGKAVIQSESITENTTVLSSNHSFTYFTCGSCRHVLFQLSDTVTHAPPKSFQPSNCTSYFLHESPSWLVSSRPDQINGKITCPKCTSKLGHWSWSGLQCGCTSWVTPAFQIIKSKVDLKVDMSSMTLVGSDKSNTGSVEDETVNKSGIMDIVVDPMSADADEHADNADY